MGAWLNPIEPSLTRHFIADDRLLLHTVRKEAHFDTGSHRIPLNRMTLSAFILAYGAGDDLGR